MRKSNAGFGLFLVMIGVLWLLSRTEYVGWFTIHSLLTLWPLIIIIIGINIIFNKELIKVISWILFFAIIVSYGYVNNNDKYNLGGKNTTYTVERDQDVKHGELKVELGGLYLNIESSENELFEANINLPNVHVKTDDKEENMIYASVTKKNYTFKRVNNNYSGVIALSNDVVWDMDLSMGAIKAEFNLKDMMVKRIDIKAGAGDFQLHLGNKYSLTGISIETGATNVDIVIPKDVGVKVDSTGALYSLNLNDKKDFGWEKIDGVNYSSNYESAASKIEIEVKTAMSNISINSAN